MSAAVVTADSAQSAWIHDAPVHWTRMRLRFAYEFNPSKSEVRPLDPLLPVTFLPMENVGEYGSVVLDEERSLEDVLSGYTYFRDGDVIVAKITPCFENGKGAAVGGLRNGIGFGSTEFHVLRPQSGHDARFAYYLTRGDVFRVPGEAAMTGSAGQQRVPESYLKDFWFAAPPPEEQRAIAAYLDRKTAAIDDLLAQKGRQLALLSATRQAVIAHAVTHGLDPDAPMRETGLPWIGMIPRHWDLTQVRYVSRSLQTGPFGSQLHAEEYVRGGWPVINPANLSDGQLVPDWDVTVDDETKDRLDHHALEEGDIVFARRGELGRFGLVKKSEVGWLCGTGSLRMRPDQQLATSDFLFYLLDTPVVVQYLDARSVGATMSNLNTDILGRMPLPMPPRLEQYTIIEYLDHKLSDLAGARESVSRQVALLHRYRQSVITAAVTGQLDISTP